MDCKSCPTDMMQGVGNIVQAFIAFLTLLATVAIALYAYRVSQGQIRPLLSLDIENGKRYTLIQLLNNGLGPANITKITYKLYGQQAREDILEEDLENEENLQKAVAASIRADGEPTGGRVYLLRHKEVHQPHEPDLSIPQLRELLDVGNVEEGMVAGQVLKAGGNIVLLRAAVKEDPAGIDNGPARAWLRLLRRMVNGAVVEVEYTDARGIKMPKYIGVITMPAPPAPAAAGAAAVGSGGSVQGQAGMAAGNSSSMGAASGSSSHAAGAPGKGSHVLQMSDVWAGRDTRDAAEKMLPGQHSEHSV